MKWKKMAMVETGKSVSDLPVQTTLRNVGAKFVVYTHVAGWLAVLLLSINVQPLRRPSFVVVGTLNSACITNGIIS